MVPLVNVVSTVVVGLVAVSVVVSLVDVDVTVE